MTKFISIVLFLLYVIPSYGELIISRIEAVDKTHVCLTLKGTPSFYGYSEWEKGCIFPNEKNQLRFAINREHIDDRGYRHTLIKILEKDSDKYLGEIEFRYIPDDSYQHQDSFISIEASTIPFPHAEETHYDENIIVLPRKDYIQLISKINVWNPLALPIIQSPNQDLMERCSLLIQFIWSLTPRIDFPPPYINRLTLIQTLKGLENQDFGILCGDFSTIFMKLVANLMQDIPVRRILAFECHYPQIYKNIHPNSHAFIEVYNGDHWVYLDPYLRVYFKDRSRKLLGAYDLRTLIHSGEYENCVPNHIPTIIPTCENIFDLYRIPQCLNWFVISNVINRK